MAEKQIKKPHKNKKPKFLISPRPLCSSRSESDLNEIKGALVSAPRISPKTTGATGIPHPLNYSDAAVTQVDAAVEIKSPITKCPALTGRNGL